MMRFVAVSKLIVDLTNAANGTKKLKPTQTAKLLRRAAATIKKYRDRSEVIFDTAEWGPLQIDTVFELLVMANSVDLFSSDKISAILIEAAETISTMSANR